jgi:hypothetical protein
MPVNGGFNSEVVLDKHFQVISFVHVDKGTGQLSVNEIDLATEPVCKTCQFRPTTAVLIPIITWGSLFATDCQVKSLQCCERQWGPEKDQNCDRSAAEAADIHVGVWSDVAI